MRAVITVIGKDTVGILAKVSSKCADNKANIIDVTQTVMQDMFAMIMLASIDDLSVPFTQFVDDITAIGKDIGCSVHVMHEDIFNSMHKI